MIVMDVARGFYNYISFLVPQDNTYWREEEAVDKVPNPAGEDQDEVIDAAAGNLFQSCVCVIRNS